jgi:hypothetical protein
MGTFGKLHVPGEFECYTIERPWAQNRANVSCIPSGTYDLVLGRYNRGGYEAYEVVDVPGRELVKIHKANLATEVLGCIAPGFELGCLDGRWAVLRSLDAFDAFMSAMGGEDGTLEITNTGG